METKGHDSMTLSARKKKTKLQILNNKKIAETKWYFTPSVLKSIRAAWMNFILPFCIFVLTVSSGWEMNILHAPDKTDQDKIALVEWSTITYEYFKFLLNYQRKLPPRNHNVKPFCISISRCLYYNLKINEKKNIELLRIEIEQKFFAQPNYARNFI